MQYLRKIGSYSVTALAMVKAHLLGDMPKRHVGYALTLDGKISGLSIKTNHRREILIFLNR